MRRRLRVVTVAVALVVATSGCSDEANGPMVSAARSTTTNAAAAADLVTPSPPLPAADIVRALEGAVDASDICALAAAMDLATPDPADPGGVVATYEELARATAAARSFVPAELRVAWETIVTGTTDAATAVAEADGDVADPDVELALTSSAMISAIESVERFQIKRCAAASTG